jgi:hypothetical protein
VKEKNVKLQSNPYLRPIKQSLICSIRRKKLFSLKVFPFSRLEREKEIKKGKSVKERD